MRIEISFNTDNAAFDQEFPEQFESEIDRIMSVCANYIKNNHDDEDGFRVKILDINGNTVGSLEIQ